MKNIILIILLTIIYSCNSRSSFYYRSNRNSKKITAKQIFIKQFKDDIFYSCLREGYGESLSSEIFKLMDKKDLFSPSDDPNPKLDSIQDNLAKKIIGGLPKPYLHVEDEKDLVGKNFIISTCLSYYESKEIDSISKKLYKQKVEEEKKNWGEDYKN